MNRSQLTILGVAVLLVVGMFFLPKVVVNKKQSSLEGQKEKPKQEKSSQDTHQAQVQLSETQRQKLQTWKIELQKATSMEKKKIWADSIAQIFRQVNRIDSSAYYYVLALGESNKIADKRLIGDTWFEAFRFALSVDAERANQYGEKARNIYEKLLAENPKLYAVKANLAMTYVATPTPMKGIGLLREILAEDANNELALFNLGLLAMQSGQFDKAVSRFDSLLKVNPNHIEAKMYLAESLLNTQNNLRAKQILTEVSNLKEDSLALYKQIAKETLNKIK